MREEGAAEVLSSACPSSWAEVAYYFKARLLLCTAPVHPDSGQVCAQAHGSCRLAPRLPMNTAQLTTALMHLTSPQGMPAGARDLVVGQPLPCVGKESQSLPVKPLCV